MGKADKPGKHYVLGFWRDPEDRVLLIRKTKPDWQKGPWNGIGGSVEEGESYHEAMVREFAEEAGVRTEREEWDRACTVTFPNDVNLHVFRGQGPLGDFNSVCDEGTLFLHERMPRGMEISAAWLYLMCFDHTCNGATLVANL